MIINKNKSCSLEDEKRLLRPIQKLEKNTYK
jgi:hypothetical protein